MGYQPKSEEQLAKEGLIQDGTYDFEVVETSDKQSAKGNDMYTLKLNVFVDDSTRVIFDYIALGSNFGERKLRHAADACGILDIYDTGNMVPADFMGKYGKVDITMQDGTAQYPNPKNVVKDYIKREPGEKVEKPVVAAAVIDDEIPF